MSRSSEYEVMKERIARLMAQEFRDDKQSPKARLTLIANNNQETENDTMNPQQVNAAPLMTEDELEQMQRNLELVVLASDALAGIGAMLFPEGNAADEQMNMTRRSEASAVFTFLGKALYQPTRDLEHHAGRVITRAMAR
ncbi:hypothetical protein CCR84_13625 [Rhodocyclus purpureus]|nr:hypothetical protein [Rhodocyclus purpureus]